MIIRNLIARYENNDRDNDRDRKRDRKRDIDMDRDMDIKDSVLYKKHYRISHLFQYPMRYKGVLTGKEYKEGIEIGKKMCDLIFVD